MDDILQLTEAASQAALAMKTLETETLEARRERTLAYGRALLKLRNRFKSPRLFHEHLVVNGLDAGNTGFRADAMWLARGGSTLLSKVELSPYSNPTNIRQWLRKQDKLQPKDVERQAVVVNEKDRRRARLNGDYSAMRVCHSYMELGKPLTELEAILLFGNGSLQRDVSHMRRKGIRIETSWVSYPEVLKRMNKNKDVSVTVPPQLPVKDLQMAQYRILR